MIIALCININICICVCTCTYVHLYIYIYICTYVHICMVHHAGLRRFLNHLCFVKLITLYRKPTISTYKSSNLCKLDATLITHDDVRKGEQVSTLADHSNMTCHAFEGLASMGRANTARLGVMHWSKRDQWHELEWMWNLIRWGDGKS